MGNTIQLRVRRWALTLGTLAAVIALAAVPAVPAAAQGAAQRQVCTGYAGNQKCNNIDVAGMQTALTSYLQTVGQQSGAPGGSVQPIGQQIQTIIQQLNSGNLPPNGGPGTTPPSVSQQEIEAQLQQLQQLAQQYLAQAGNPGNPNPAPAPNPTPGPNPTPTHPPTPAPTPPPAPGPNPNPNPNGAPDLTKICQQLQENVDKKIASLNSSAQDALARLDAALVKLQAYQSSTGSQVDPQLLAAVQQAQADATQAVAMLSALSVKVDCSQPASAVAGALSTIKASADAAKAQLQDFQKALSDLINSLATQAKP